MFTKCHMFTHVWHLDTSEERNKQQSLTKEDPKGRHQEIVIITMAGGWKECRGLACTLTRPRTAATESMLQA